MTTVSGQGNYPYKRRNFFINKKLQGRVIAYFLILGLIVTLSASGLIWYLSMEEFDKFIYRTHLSSTSPWKVILPVLIKALAASTVLLVISTLVITHLVFRKFTTKLKPFNSALLDMGNGNLNATAKVSTIESLDVPFKAFSGRIRNEVASLRDIYSDMKRTAENTEENLSEEAVLNKMKGLNTAFVKKLSEWQLLN